MRAVTSQFDVSRSHGFLARAILLDTGEELPIKGGNVQLSSTDDIRTSADVQVAATGQLDWVPVDVDSVLAPTDNELLIQRGIRYDDGTTEYVSLATVRIEKVGVDDTGDDLTIALTCLDRAKKFQDAQFEKPYEVAAGTNVIDAITSLMQSVDSTVVMNLPILGYLTPLLVANEGDDPWSFCRGLAQWCGHELFFDGDGELAMPAITQVTPAVLDVSEGEEGILTDIDVEWDREVAFNRAIVTGENVSNTGTVPRGVATDEDASSPTYYYGDFGPKPVFFNSEFVTTQTQAEAAAQGLLTKNMGIGKTVNFGAVDHPALEPLDAVRVNRPRVGITQEVMIVDTVTHPLSREEPMRATTRTVREV